MQHHGTCSPLAKLPCQCPHTITITSSIFSNVVTRDAGCYCRERADAVAGLRQARAESMQVSMPKPASSEGFLAGPLSLVPQPSSLDLAAGIDDLMAALKPRHSQAGGGASEDGSSALSGEFRIGSYRTPQSVQSEICCMFGRAQTILSAAWDCDPSALLISCLPSIFTLRMLCLQAQHIETAAGHHCPLCKGTIQSPHASVKSAALILFQRFSCTLLSQCSLPKTVPKSTAVHAALGNVQHNTCFLS